MSSRSEICYDQEEIRNALDNSSRVTDSLVAGPHWRRGWKPDSPLAGSCASDPGYSIDYRKTSIGLDHDRVSL